MFYNISHRLSKCSIFEDELCVARMNNQNTQENLRSIPSWASRHWHSSWWTPCRCLLYAGRADGSLSTGDDGRSQEQAGKAWRIGWARLIPRESRSRTKAGRVCGRRPHHWKRLKEEEEASEREKALGEVVGTQRMRLSRVGRYGGEDATETQRRWLGVVGLNSRFYK